MGHGGDCTPEWALLSLCSTPGNGSRLKSPRRSHVTVPMRYTLLSQAVAVPLTKIVVTRSVRNTAEEAADVSRPARLQELRGQL